MVRCASFARHRAAATGSTRGMAAGPEQNRSDVLTLAQVA
jgi:hypothetical protein